MDKRLKHIPIRHLRECYAPLVNACILKYIKTDDLLSLLPDDKALDCLKDIINQLPVGALRELALKTLLERSSDSSSSKNEQLDPIIETKSQQTGTATQSNGQISDTIPSPKPITTESPSSDNAECSVMQQVASRKKQKKKKKSVDEVECQVSPTVVSSVGVTSRAECMSKYRPLRRRTLEVVAGKICNGGPFYPEICTKRGCTLCTSWFASSYITPCNLKFGCKTPCSVTKYYAHSTSKALSKLRKYHHTIDAIPYRLNTHAVRDNEPEFEDSFLKDPLVKSLIDGAGDPDHKIWLRNLVSVCTPLENQVCSSDSETDSDHNQTRLSDARRERNDADGIKGSASSTTSSIGPCRSKKPKV